MLLRFTALLLATAAAYAADRPPAADKDAPVISDLNVDPSAGPVDTRYTVSVRITDPRGPGDIVPTLFQIRERVESIPLTINDQGENGDAVAGDGVYTAVTRVPPSAAAGTHTFAVFVRSRTGRQSNTLLYQFTVLKGDVVDGGGSMQTAVPAIFPGRYRPVPVGRPRGS